jgi:hypothetical protein
MKHGPPSSMVFEIGMETTEAAYDDSQDFEICHLRSKYTN